EPLRWTGALGTRGGRRGSRRWFLLIFSSSFGSRWGFGPGGGPGGIGLAGNLLGVGLRRGGRLLRRGKEEILADEKHEGHQDGRQHRALLHAHVAGDAHRGEDRKSTRLNSSHVAISYAVFCLKKKKVNKMR